MAVMPYIRASSAQYLTAVERAPRKALLRWALARVTGRGVSAGTAVTAEQAMADSRKKRNAVKVMAHAKSLLRSKRICWSSQGDLQVSIPREDYA